MHDDKRQVVAALNATISEFPFGRGRRNSELLPRAACLAVKSGVSEDTFTDEIKGVAPDMSNGDIRRAYRSAARKVDTSHTTDVCFTRKTRVENTTPKFPHRVRSLIHAGRDIATPDDLMRLSPFPIGRGTAWGDTVTQMRWLFPNPDAIAYVFRIGDHGATPGVMGKSMKRIDDWLHSSCPVPPDEAGEQIVPNPFTGRQGTTTDGTPSFIAQSCLAAYPHIIMEFDHLPIDEQCRFWAGFIRNAKLPLICLVHSGGKSIHGCVRINAANLATWNAMRARFVDLYAADDDAAFRVDTDAMRPRQGMRLAGAIRQSTGERQRLLWACPWNTAMKGGER